MSPAVSLNFLHLPPALRFATFARLTTTPICRRCLTTATHLEDDLSTSRSPYTSPLTVAQPLLTLSPATLNSYDISPPPETNELKHAATFFSRIPPVLLFTAPYFRSFPPSNLPEVAFLGRSNVGKSSLLNALFGRPNVKDAHVSKRPGKTKTMNGFGVGGEGLVGAKAKHEAKVDAKEGSDPTWKRFGRGGLVVVDMPGYGSGSREEWGSEIMKYLQNRKQLRRTFVLVDTEHGLKRSDLELLLHLRKQGIPHQVVLSKVDKMLYPDTKVPSALKLHNRLLKLRNVCEEVKEKLNEAASEMGGRSAMLDLVCCSSEKSMDERGKNRRIGIDELRWEILRACGLESRHLPQTKAQKEKGERKMKGGVEEDGRRSAYAPMET